MSFDYEGGSVFFRKHANLRGVWAGNFTLDEFQADLEVGKRPENAFAGPAVKMCKGGPKKLVKMQEPMVGIYLPVAS